MRARGAYVRSDLGENLSVGTFPFPFLDREVFPFPSALQGPIQLQLALSVSCNDTQWAFHRFDSRSAVNFGELKQFAAGFAL